MNQVEAQTGPNLFSIQSNCQKNALYSPWPILMRKAEVIGMKQAEDMTDLSAKTIKRWCKEFGIGAHSCSSAPWRISAPALMMVLHGDICALELLRQGNRTHARVARYYDELGIQPGSQ
ncbi:MAG: hypothetical protein JJ866_10105 [Roseibium sp.]|uniref:hypothetical protein n=1 Tax=Roseibium sp. TaxID=1936156 RepID=UPI001B1CA675|nr:hypothetical protein [Roseibium sp.]MBO6892280.1 hypothetical protein [Roseibium sp.]MBO6929895.1 hypothetical protein [Roseibium sp.]